MNTKQIGNIGEAKTLLKFVENCIPIYTSFGDNERSDFIIDWNGQLKRIQCKTSEKVVKGIINFSLVSSTVHRKNGVKHKYTKEEIDFFVLYNMESDLLLFLPIEKLLGKTSVSFALEYKPSRNQYEALNWEDYLFEKIMCVETLHETSLKEDEDKVQTTTEIPA